MARIINTAKDDLTHLGKMQTLYVYNGLDTAITLEVLEKTLPLLTSDIIPVYNFALGLQAPMLEIMLRGIEVDENAKSIYIQELEAKREKVDHVLQTLAEAAWGAGLNHNSPKQLQAFFYSHMKLPPVVLSFKGVRRPSTNREALEKLHVYIYARPFIECILALRDYTKLLSVLRKGVDEDGRFRFSINIGGTETGRVSSSENAFGTGDNIQNKTESVRHIFVASKNRKMAYADLEQAESRAVAALSGDEAYWEACHGGDLHTTVTKMVWRNLPWTGDPKRDKKEIAGKIFYRHFTYRDMSKRGGHGSNYLGTPWTMARHLKVPSKVMEEFQGAYFTAFPGIPRWHGWVARELQTKGFITTPLGRRRHFFARRDADETLRQAVAHEPQSHVGDVLNLALWRVWKAYGPDKRDPGRLCVYLLAQIHDAIKFEYNPHYEKEILSDVLELMTIPVPVRNRILTIPTEVSVGWNWGKYVDEFDAAKRNIPINLNGLKEWRKNEPDQRTRLESKKTNLLDSVISRVY